MDRLLRKLLLPAVITTLLGPVSAILTVEHGRTTYLRSGTNISEVFRVEGVAVLDLGGTTIVSHYFDCENTNGASSLVWERAGGTVRFPSTVEGDALRLDMSPDGSPAVDYPDLDVYTCRDTLTGDSAPINITGGLTAICPVEPTLDIGFGENASLRVYVDGNPPVLSSEIIWFAPDGSVISSGGRYTLLDSNKRLLLRNAELEDSGTYRINIRRLIFSTTFHTVTSTIQLTVQEPLSTTVPPPTVPPPTVPPPTVPPPTSTVFPTSYTASEGESAQFQCQAGGTDPTVIWQLEGNQPLPSGVVQNGNNLVIDSATRNHARQYFCIVVDITGNVATSVAVLMVSYAPTATISTITREGTGAISVNQLLSITAEQGDPGPTFSCASNGFPLPTLTWSALGGSFPRGVTESVLPTRRTLVWSRLLEYTDSGRYDCTAQNSNGTSTASLNLLVRQSPIILSIYSNSPFISFISSLSNFFFPEAFSGTILTCTALGWPTPTIEWLQNGLQALDGRIISNFTSYPNSTFVSVRLRWSEGFEGSDVGNYTCILRATDTNAVQSTSVSLDLTTPSISSLKPIECSVTSLQTYFQIRVFDTECLSWDESLKGNITRSFLNVVLSIIVAECSECNDTTDNVEIIDPLTCSNLVDKAALFKGSISTQQITKTEDIFCTLRSWQEKGAIVQINNNFHRIDSNCEFNSNITSECSLQDEPSRLKNAIYIVTGIVAVAVLLVITIVGIFFVTITFRPLRIRR